jgi:hypothetical protein
MKDNVTINSFIKGWFIKSLLVSLLSVAFFTVKAQQYTEHFENSPAFTSYPGVPAWIQTATVTLGGTVYEFANAGNGGWEYKTTGGVSDSSNLLYSTAATTFVTIRRQDGKRFQFYGAWLKYSNLANGYSPPWLRVNYNGSNEAAEIYGNNSTVTLEKDVNVINVTINFSGLFKLNFDDIIVGPATPITPISGTETISIFSDTAAVFSGSVTDDGGADVTESGLVYGTSAAPDVNDNKLILGTGVSSYSDTVTSLQRGTTYYVRSYAVNSAGISYGNEESFTTFGTFVMAGTHNFNSEWVSTLNQNSPFTKYVEGWDATGESTGAGLISIERLSGTEVEEGTGALSVFEATFSEELMYLSMKPNDGSLFNLQSFMFRYDVQEVNTMFGTVTVTGYKNGVAVPGATQTVINAFPTSMVVSYNTFTADENIFNGIDEFRLTASNSLDDAKLYRFDIDAIMATTSGILPVTFSSIKAYQKNAGIQVDWNVATESNVHHYEIEKSQSGQQFLKAFVVFPKANNYTSASYSWLDVNVSSGNNFYRIKSVYNTGLSNNSQVINVILGGVKPAISVHPNPITGSEINLQLNTQPKGMYTIQLYNNAGQQLYNKRFEHNGGSLTQTIDIKNNFVKGIYQLKVSNSSKSYTKQIIKN